MIIANIMVCFVPAFWKADSRSIMGYNGGIVYYLREP